MEYHQLITLALIQGITEFLPISSSAHLILPIHLWGWPDQGLAFDVAVHLGTLLAVLLHFRHELKQLAIGSTQALSKKQTSPEVKLIGAIILGFLPAALLGFFCESLIEAHLRSITTIIITTIGFGLLLWFSDQKSSGHLDLKDMTLVSALLIGCAQAMALIPGTSRSGITITAALLLGFSRTSAAQFSFLLSIPIILGASVMQIIKVIEGQVTLSWSVFLMAGTLSGISAFLCIHIFLRLIDRIGLWPFVFYRLLLGGYLALWFL